MDDKINKSLTEAMGECWQCSCCGRVQREEFNCRGSKYVIYDFSTWEGFGKLWEWAIEQGWFLDFIKDKTYIEDTPEECHMHTIWFKMGLTELINPERFANAVYEYLKNN